MIPPTRYIDAGPAMPEASTRAATAPGLALSQVGEAVAGAGDKVYDIAARIRVTEDAGKISAFMANADKEADDFETGLARRHDAANWAPEWKTSVAARRESLAALKLSPDGMAKARLEFTAWEARKTGSFEKAAMVKTVQEGRARMSTAYSYYLGAGKYDEAEAERIRMKNSGNFSPAEMDRLDREFETTRFTHHLDERIRLDPYEAEKFVNSGEYLKTPGATPDSRLAALGRIRTQKDLNVRNMTDEYENAAATGKIRDPGEIDRRFGGRAPAFLIEKMKGDLTGRAERAMAERRRAPEYQSQVAGRASGMIDAYRAGITNGKFEYFDVKALLRELPEGSAIRERLTAELDKIGPDREAVIRDGIDHAYSELDKAYRNGRFGSIAPVPDAMPVEEAIGDGFLRDRKKLAAWFSGEQVDSISGIDESGRPLGARPLTDEQRAERFREEWASRAKKDATGEGFAEATAAAIRKRESRITYLSPEAERRFSLELEKTNESYGEARTSLANWIRFNPGAPEPEIRRRVLEIADHAVRARHAATIVPEKPPAHGDPSAYSHADPRTTAKVTAPRTGP